MPRSGEGWGTCGSINLVAGAVTDDPPDFALRRHGLGAEAARRPELGADGIPSVAPPVPER